MNPNPEKAVAEKNFVEQHGVLHTKISLTSTNRACACDAHNAHARLSAGA